MNRHEASMPSGGTPEEQEVWHKDLIQAVMEDPERYERARLEGAKNTLWAIASSPKYNGKTELMRSQIEALRTWEDISTYLLEYNIDEAELNIADFAIWSAYKALKEKNA